MRAAVVVFVIGVIACAVAHVAILVSIVRRPRPAASEVAEHVPRPRQLVEVMWALVPIVALALVLTATWSRVKNNATPRPDVMMKIAK